MRFRRIWCLGLLIAVSVGLLAAPAVAAQAEKTDLQLRILPEYYYRDVNPGETDTVYMEVRNAGEVELTDIVFEADAPDGWQLAFSPATIEAMAAGSSETVDILVTSPKNADDDNYNLTVIAKAAETRAATTFMVRIENGFSQWLWVGVGVVVLVIIGFVLIYRRFGTS